MAKEEIIKNGLYWPSEKYNNVELFRRIAKDKKNKTILLLLDGFGFNKMKKILSFKNFEKFYKYIKLEKITTIFPSYTPCVIPSLESGLYIGEHGIVGDNMPFREEGGQLNIYAYPWGEVAGLANELQVAPRNFIIEKFSKRKFVYLQDENLYKKYKNNFDVVSFKNVDMEPYIDFFDLVLKIKNYVLKNEKDLIYVYYDYSDEVGHKYSQEQYGEKLLSMFLSYLFENIIEPSIDNGYRIIITSDHGQVSFNKKKIVNFKIDSSFMKHLFYRPWGTHRVMFFEVLENHYKAFENEIMKKISGKALLFRSDELIDDGIYIKKVNDRFRYRFGNYTLIALDNFEFYYNETPQFYINLKGSHGGLSSEEMLIPKLTIEN